MPLALPPLVPLPLCAPCVDPVSEPDHGDDNGSELDLGPDTAHETPKPSRAGGPGGVAGVLPLGSAPAAGLYSPRVCAQLPCLQSHEPFPFAFLALAFVLVWLCWWVALLVRPPCTHPTGSALGDAASVFLVPLLALLGLAFGV